jgi:hypothetical protein
LKVKKILRLNVGYLLNQNSVNTGKYSDWDRKKYALNVGTLIQDFTLLRYLFGNSTNTTMQVFSTNKQLLAVLSVVEECMYKPKILFNYSLIDGYIF